MQVGRSVLLGLVALTALLTAGNAALWLIVPARAAEALKMPLLTGAALSTQPMISSIALPSAWKKPSSRSPGFRSPARAILAAGAASSGTDSTHRSRQSSRRSTLAGFATY